MRTKAMSGWRSGGRPEKKASKAANPPAEAPMPTMGKVAGSREVRAVAGDVLHRGLERLFFKP
jgi:hypothetical protein